MYSDYQIFPTKPAQFSFDEFEETHKYGTNPKLRVYADFMRPNRQIEKFKI